MGSVSEAVKIERESLLAMENSENDLVVKVRLSQFVIMLIQMVTIINYNLAKRPSFGQQEERQDYFRCRLFRRAESRTRLEKQQNPVEPGLMGVKGGLSVSGFLCRAGIKAQHAVDRAITCQCRDKGNDTYPAPGRLWPNKYQGDQDQSHHKSKQAICGTQINFHNNVLLVVFY